MHGLSPVDEGRTIDWGKTSDDYAAHRPGPPDSFYDVLRALGIGVASQRIIDLGTGTGALARRFARQGARVAGVDISEGQVRAAREMARAEGVEVDFRVAAAEATPFADGSFDVATANQCFLYFDAPRAVAEVRRLTGDSGRLVTSHFSYLALEDPIAAASEALILEHNPQWSAAGFSGEVPRRPAWADGSLDVRAMVVYDVDVPFTREAWRGRIRASRGIGASLAPAEVERFDAAHEALLERIAPERFAVRHRIDIHVLAFRQGIRRG